MISKNNIKFVHQLEQKKYRRKEGLFVAEGPKVVGDLLHAGFTPRMLFAVGEWITAHHMSAMEVTDDELRKLSFLQHPQQVLGVLELPTHRNAATLNSETLYLAPPDTPELQGLRVLRAGLELGTLRKGRFEPAHALAMWLDGAKNTLSLGADDPAVLRYLHGETLPCAAAGWTLVQVDGHSLGWGKSSAGTLKNHYPKGLRRK